MNDSQFDESSLLDRHSEHVYLRPYIFNKAFANSNSVKFLEGIKIESTLYPKIAMKLLDMVSFVIFSRFF